MTTYGEDIYITAFVHKKHMNDEDYLISEALLA